MKLLDLFEAIPPSAHWFHATNLEVIKSILDSNVLRADTHHAATDVYADLKQDPKNFNKQIQGVSLTRDKKFAEEWADVVLVFDSAKLKQNYKVVQVAYFADDTENNREESEEFVIGSIKNLNRYLIGIYFPARLENKYTDWKWVCKNIKPVHIEFEGWKTVLENPKYIGKQMMNTRLKAVGESSALFEMGRIIAGVNTPSGITVDHTKRMAAALGFKVNRDGYAPTLLSNGKINQEVPAEKDHTADDKKSMFAGADLTPLTNGKTKDMVSESQIKETTYTNLYHGSSAANNITASGFSYDFMGKGNDQYGYGFYFTNDKSVAQQYFDDTLKASVTLKKPIVINGDINSKDQWPILTTNQVYMILSRAPNIRSAEGPLSNWGDVESEGWDNVIKSCLENYTHDFFALANDFFPHNPKEFVEAYRYATGYDGVKVEFKNNVKFIVAWFPNQIRIYKNED